MKLSPHKAVTVAVLATVLLTASIAGPAAAATGGVQFAATNNTTTTTQAQTTQTSEQCDPSNPELQQARLYTDDPTITKDSPGVISGSLVTDITNDCRIVVQLTLTVPNGMYIQGSSDVGSGGGGLVTNTIEVDPGESKSLRATVFSNNLGTKTVTADLTYFPKGHKDMARELDGQMLEFTTEEKAMPDTKSDGGNESVNDASTPNEGRNTLLGGESVWSKNMLTIVIVGLLLLLGAAMYVMVPDTFKFDFDIGKR